MKKQSLVQKTIENVEFALGIGIVGGIVLAVGAYQEAYLAYSRSRAAVSNMFHPVQEGQTRVLQPEYRGLEIKASNGRAVLASNQDGKIIGEVTNRGTVYVPASRPNIPSEDFLSVSSGRKVRFVDYRSVDQTA